uniref:Uncharacterized protein n=1 Tax=Moniliophthora roreri TaxID=221103 RepID=A0A0W0FYH5_MONRR
MPPCKQQRHEEHEYEDAIEDDSTHKQTFLHDIDEHRVHTTSQTVSWPTIPLFNETQTLPTGITTSFEDAPPRVELGGDQVYAEDELEEVQTQCQKLLQEYRPQFEQAAYLIMGQEACSQVGDPCSCGQKDHN